MGKGIYVWIVFIIALVIIALIIAGECDREK